MRVMFVVLVAATVAALVSGCGGSSGADSEVNGCRIEAGTSCPGADLSAADLEDADLSQADLSGANLTDANLEGANLTEANLSDARIVNVDLSDADLTRADLTGATISGTSLDDATLCGTTRTDGTVDDASCPASGGTTTSTDAETTESATTETGASEAEVTSFDVGQLDCGSGVTSGSVTLTWATQAATAVRIDVDGTEVASAGPSGSQQVAVPCDGQSHEVSVTPLSDSGPGEPESEDVEASG